MWKWQKRLGPRVSAAFDKVDRVHFVPEALRDQALLDEALPIGDGQTISQPYVVAIMLDVLDLRAGDRVLEIGTGSGYQTAILCELTAQPDQPKGTTVYSIERIPALAEQAQNLLQRLDYYPHLRVGDGAAGWMEAAPFTAIVISAATPKIADQWWQQLVERGNLIVPVGDVDSEQTLQLIRKIDGKQVTSNLGSVRFVPLLSPLLGNLNDASEDAAASGDASSASEDAH